MTSRVMLALCFVFPIISAQAAQELTVADQKLLSGYSLSMEKLRGYQDAVAKMDAACRNDPAVREAADSAAPKPGTTLEQAIKDIGETPLYKRFMKPAGLAAQDVVLLPIVLMGAGAVVEAHADPAKLKGLSDAQVAFYRAHRDEIQKLKLTGDCEGGEGEE